MYGFTISEDLRKTLHNLYLFGFIGIVSRIYGLKSDQFPVVGPLSPNIDLSGFCGVIVTYLSISFIFRYISGYFEHEEGRLREAEASVVKTYPVHQVDESAVLSPESEGVVAAIKRRRTRHFMIIRNSRRIIFLADLVAPLLFIVACWVELRGPAAHFLVDLIGRF